MSTKIPTAVLIAAKTTETWKCQKCCNNRGELFVCVVGNRRYANGFGATSAAKLQAAGFVLVSQLKTA